ncbi:MAG: glycerophosphodiester phosphodiesterase family protein [Phycisphaeraceae bacterium]
MGCASSQVNWSTLDGEPPAVIAHRGDSGAYPEHTFAAYRSALEKGADFIEPDIVLTKDGVPVCRHDLELEKTTDVAARPKFADRKANGKNWLTTDFTLAEIKTLRATQPAKGRDRSMDGKYAIPTLSELFDLVYDYNQTHGTNTGLLIEIKNPDRHRVINLDVNLASVDVINAKAAEGKTLPIIYQCFDRSACERIVGLTDAPVHWLSSKQIDLADLPKGISGLGLKKSLIDLADGRSALIDAAHAQGVRVHAWTFRDDRLPKGIDPKQPADEMLPYLRAGLDGVITDFPETGVAARKAILDELQAERKSEGPISERARRQSSRRLMKIGVR